MKRPVSSRVALFAFLICLPAIHAALATPLLQPPRDHDPAVQSYVDEVSETSFQGYIQALEDFVTRNARMDEYYQSALWAAGVFSSFGLPSGLQEFHAVPDPQWGGDPFTCWNVVAVQTGAVYPDQILVLCGHLDSTAGGAAGEEPVAPGADDNGSGSAAVLESARILSQHSFACTIHYVLFGAEEQCHGGSLAYVDSLAAAGAQVLGAVNYDMILYDGDDNTQLRVIYNDLSENLAMTFAAACALYIPQLDVWTDWRPWMIASDHYSFWLSDMPALLGIENEYVQNPYLHSTDDILANYLEFFPFGTHCVRGAVASVAAIAEPMESAGVFEIPGAGGGLRLSLAGRHPVADQARVLLTLGEPAQGVRPPGSEVLLQVLDPSGRARLSRWVLPRSNEEEISLAVADLPSGVYWIRAASYNGSAAQRLVILR